MVTTTKEAVSERLTEAREAARTASSDLFKASRRYRWVGIIAQLILAVAIGFLGGRWGPWLGLASLLPSAIDTIERRLAFQEGSGWHHELRVELDRLLTELEAGEQPIEVLRKFHRLEATMGKRFPHGSPV